MTELRDIPGVDRLLADPAIDALTKRFGRLTVKQALTTLQNGWRSAREAPSWAANVAAYANHIEPKLRNEDYQTVINLTGTMLHSNLGRASLSRAVLEKVFTLVTQPASLEYDVGRGKRGDRDTPVAARLQVLTDAEDATVVNNNAAAVLLVLNTLALDREVPVSRGELIEIGGSFRLPDIMARAGCRLKEVGATNRTHGKDFRAAISDATGCLLKIHPSNYTIEGFTKSVSLTEMAEIAAAADLPLCIDLGSGTLVNLERWGLPHEPTPSEMLRQGADLVTFSGDKLLGAVQSGVIVGKSRWIQQIKQNPLKRALRPDKLTLMILQETLKLYESPDLLPEQIPLLKSLLTPQDELERRAVAVKGHARPTSADLFDQRRGEHLSDGERLAARSEHPERERGHRQPPARRRSETSSGNFGIYRFPVIGRVSKDQLWLDMRGAGDIEQLESSLRAHDKPTDGQRPVIITLAGHVDHGKTSLVRALTGVNTDRLAEEQARGLTIDLGFAYINLGSHRIGFVDVPGHHRFIHNMVAGVASNQFALLVVAADDGPMPQTIEHLNILKLTGVRAGVVALTKSDRASAERLAEVEAAIRAVTAGTFLAGSNIVRTSTESGAGIEQLSDVLRQAAERHELAAPQAECFRMAIDRTFTIRGSGLVVTGTVHGGKLTVGDNVNIYPKQLQARVRSIHAQDTEAATTQLGDRAAVNLTGVDPQAVTRGDWVAESGLASANNITLRLNVLADFPRQLKHWSPVHVYHATSHTTGRVALLDASQLAPGTDGLADIVCDDPLLVKHGDTLVLRDQSLDLTLGGGQVIAVGGADTRRRSTERLARLACFETADPQAAFDGLLELGPFAIPLFAQTWGIPADTVTGWAEARGDHVVAGQVVPDTQWQAAQADALEQLKVAHQNNPERPGLKANELDVPFADAVVAALQQADSVRVEDGFVQLPDHRQKLAPELRNMFDRIAEPLDVPQPPSTGDLSKSLRVPLPQLNRALTDIANQGYLQKVSDQRFFLPERWEALVAMVRELAAAGPFNVRQFRDAAGIGRNVAIDVLEHLDRRGITQRQGDTRVLRPTSK